MPPVELQHLRSRFAKHYDLGDGFRQAVFKTGPVHFQDGGRWYDYDLNWSNVGGLWVPGATDFKPHVKDDIVTVTTVLGHTVAYQIPNRLDTVLLDPTTLRVSNDLGNIDVELSATGVLQTINVPTSRNTTWDLTYPMTLSEGGVLEQVSAKEVDAVWADERVRFTVDAVYAVDGMSYPDVVSLSIWKGDLRLTVDDRDIVGPYIVRCPDTFLSPTSDGYLWSTDISYPTAADMGTTSAVTTGDLVVGQNHPSTYTCYESFILFDTATIPDSALILTATLSLWMSADYSTTEFDVQARTKSWGATLEAADAVADHNLGALTLLASKNTSPAWSTTAYTDLTENGSNLRSAINKTGTTEMIVCDSLQVGDPGTAPIATEWVQPNSGNASGKEPKLVVTWQLSGPALVLTQVGDDIHVDWS